MRLSSRFCRAIEFMMNSWWSITAKRLMISFLMLSDVGPLTFWIRKKYKKKTLFIHLKSLKCNLYKHLWHLVSSRKVNFENKFYRQLWRSIIINCHICDLLFWTFFVLRKVKFCAGDFWQNFEVKCFWNWFWRVSQEVSDGNFKVI